MDDFVLKKGSSYEVVVLSINKERKLLEFGMKELTPNPWPDLVEMLPVGSVHQGRVLRKLDRGAIVVLSEADVDLFVPAQELRKKDGTTCEEGEEYPFIVQELLAADQKILVSHTRVWDEVALGPKRNRLDTSAYETRPDRFNKKQRLDENKQGEEKFSMPVNKKLTLGDLTNFSAIIEKLAQENARKDIADDDNTEN